MHVMSLTPYFRWLLIIAAVPLLLLLYFSPNIWGYMRFQHFCETEGGLKVYEKMERDKVWFADSKTYAKYLATLDFVGVSLYMDDAEGSLYKVEYLSGRKNFDKSYEVSKLSSKIPIDYRFLSYSNNLSNELRLTNYIVQVTRYERHSDIILQINSFSYSILNRENTLFGSPSVVTCHYSSSKNLGKRENFL